MKKYLLIACFLFVYLIRLHGQATCPSGINENFDSGIFSYSSSGTPGWIIDTNFFTSPHKCIRGQYSSSSSVEFTSPSESTLGNSVVILKFKHICKINAADGGIIEINTGSGWIQLKNGPLPAPVNCIYTGGASTFNQSFGWNFSALSYPLDWLPGQAGALPNNNTWWKQEVFDISSIAANQANVQVRFKAAGSGMQGNYGWLIDDIEFCYSNCELDGSIVKALPPVYTGQITNSGPFTMCFDITDSSGIAAAELNYSINGGPFIAIGGLQQLTATIWCGVMYDTLRFGNTFCWYVQTYDLSCNFNLTNYPPSGSYCGTYYTGAPPLPFCDNFDAATSSWTAPTSSFDPFWHSGTASCGPISSNISPPNSWFIEINNNGTTSFNFNSWLYSAGYNFTSALNAKLNFWYSGEISSAINNGVTLEYSNNNGASWNTLGTIHDACSKNWFNGTAFLRPSWVGNSQGWKNASYNLSCAPGIAGSPNVRFKFLYNGHHGNIIDNGCFKIDNFCIDVPPQKDMAVISINSPRKKAAANYPLPVKITIENAGNEPQAVFNLITSIRPPGGTWTIVNTNTWTGGIIAPGQRVNVVLPNVILPPGPTGICVRVVLTGDANASNDQVCGKVIGNANPLNNTELKNAIYWDDDTLLISNGPSDELFDFIDFDSKEQDIQFKFYPNPVRDQLFISFDHPTEQFNFSIKTIGGQEVLSQSFYSSYAYKVELKDIVPGIYIARIIADGKTYFAKLFKE